MCSNVRSLKIVFVLLSFMVCFFFISKGYGQTPTTGEIRGTVKDLESDVGISGATVATDTGGYSDITDSFGNYILRDVAAGTYLLTASKDGYQSEESRVGVTTGGTSFLHFFLIRIPTPTPSPSPSPTVVPTPIGGSITGTVRNFATKITIGGATVLTNIGGYSDVTDVAGSYIIPNVQAGNYIVTASASDYTPSSRPVNVVEGQPSQADFELAPIVTPTPTPTPTPTGTDTIEATVDIQGKTINLNSKGTFTAKIRLPSGYDIDDIRCKSIECEGAQAFKCQKDKKNKKKLVVRFHIKDLADLDVDANETKTIELTITGEMADGTLFEGSDSAKVKGKKSGGGGNGTGRIYGNVTSGSDPVKGATVTCKSKSFKNETKTDANGDFNLENLKWGKYKVTTKKKGYEDSVRRIDLSEDDSDVRLNIELKKK